MNEIRMRKIESLIQAEIGMLLLQQEIKDPRIDPMATITGVKISKDSSSARVYVSSLLDDKSLQKTVLALNHANGFIQHKLAGVLQLRNTPVLHFFPDRSIPEGIEMIQKINRINP